MKTLKRWIANIKWLFNHPPTNASLGDSKISPCDFCGSKTELYTYWRGDVAVFSICWNCMFKAYRKVLNEKTF